MNAGHDPIAPFRRRLLGLAYRMLGSISDAEDVLQDAYLRFHRQAEIANPEAFLVTIVTRLCLDQLKSAKHRREAYIGPWLPEPIFDEPAPTPHGILALAEDLSFAMLLVLDRLAPPERAAFLLHDVFGLSFAEIATVLERAEPSCRQLAARARKILRDARPPAPAPLEHQGKLLAAFGAALTSGDATALMVLLREDAVLLSDGGGKKRAARNPILGPGRIARFLHGTMRKFAAREPALASEARIINGALGVVSFAAGRVEQVMSLLAEDGKIAAIYLVRNPEKLAHLQPGGSPGV